MLSCPMCARSGTSSASTASRYERPLDPAERTLLPPAPAIGGRDKLPARFTRSAQVDRYGKEDPPKLQLVASLGGMRKGYNYGLASFCIFPGIVPEGGDPDAPYQVSSKTYHFDMQDETVLRRLRKFSASDLWHTTTCPAAAAATAPPPVRPKYRFAIKELFASSEAIMEFKDLVAMVLAVEPAQDGISHVVWAWDGTDAPPYPCG